MSLQAGAGRVCRHRYRCVRAVDCHRPTRRLRVYLDIEIEELQPVPFTMAAGD